MTDSQTEFAASDTASPNAASPDTAPPDTASLGRAPLGHAATGARAFLHLLSDQFPTLLDELGAAGKPSTAPRPRFAARPPIRVHVSDTLRDITDGVTELEEAVCDRLRIRRAKRTGVAETIRRVVRLLPRIDADPVLAEHVRDESRRMARRASRALGDDGPMLRLPGTCPHCDSVSLRHLPLDGEVWCVNPDCRCTTPDCGCAAGPGPAHSWPDTAPPRPLNTPAGSRR